MAQLSAPVPGPRKSSAAISLAQAPPTSKPHLPLTFSPSDLGFAPPTPSNTPASFEPSHYLNPSAPWMAGEEWGSSSPTVPYDRTRTPMNTPIDASYMRSRPNWSSTLEPPEEDEMAPPPPPPEDFDDEFAPAPPASNEGSTRLFFFLRHYEVAHFLIFSLPEPSHASQPRSPFISFFA